MDQLTPLSQYNFILVLNYLLIYFFCLVFANIVCFISNSSSDVFTFILKYFFVCFSYDKD